MKKDLIELLSKPVDYYIQYLTERSGTLNLTKPVILFGAGQMGEIYYNLCKKHNIRVAGIFDNDLSKHKKYFNKKLIIKSASGLSQLPHDSQIIVTSIYDDEIIAQLKELGFSHVWSHAYVSTVFPKIFHNPYWLNTINSIHKNKKNILRCYDLLEDALSRKTFITILRYRLLLQRSELSKLIQPAEHEYFDKKIIKCTNEEIYIDCGAYNGDTLKKFINFTNGKYTQIIAFEPDTDLFTQLKKYVDKVHNKKITIYPYGIGKKKSTAHFTNDGTLGSRISAQGGYAVQIVNLDTFLKVKPTYIKLDIEGAEQEALLGTRRIISKCRPKITLSIYHKTEDLWEIPLLLKKIRSDYRFYMRHYTPFLYDTICYAV